MYLILTRTETKISKIQVNTHGFPLQFNQYKEAKQYAEKYQIENYVIVAVCNDHKNYLV